MIIYKRIKRFVDWISTAQKVWTFLLWILGALSVAGNFYQYGEGVEKDKAIAAIAQSKDTIIQTKTVFVPSPPKVIEKTIVEKTKVVDCSDHEKRMHR
jgi:hypothetical protein